MTPPSDVDASEGAWLELAVEADPEAVEAVSEIIGRVATGGTTVASDRGVRPCRYRNLSSDRNSATRPWTEPMLSRWASASKNATMSLPVRSSTPEE